MGLFFQTSRAISTVVSQVEKAPLKFKIPAVIQPFSLSDIKVSPSDFFDEHLDVFNTLTPDPYDARKDQIEFLLKKFRTRELTEKLAQYYVGSLGVSALQPYTQKLSDHEKSIFDSFTSYRHRAVSTFELDSHRGFWTITRKATPQFTQTQAHIDSADRIDFRKFPRVFEELKPEYAKLSTFKATLSGVANLVKTHVPSLIKLEITVHHVRVYTRVGKITSNSPEGIHQDGFPFIVSALVVERHNVDGGDSEIFLGKDLIPIFRTRLQPGYGLLQPDSESDLWHHVTPITPEKTEGYRSSLGFDIAILK